MDKTFYEQNNYTCSDIESLIANEVEENIHLDYKESGSISKEDKKRTEITKDVSAFANSDGGIIIYGLSEKDHYKPGTFSYIDGNIFSKEWLENVINLIQPRIDGVKIHPIRIDNDLSKSIYIVKIPRSEHAPHMARDKRYYKRFNFMSEPMEDYEVKDIIHRHNSPTLEIVGASLERKESQKFNDDNTVIFSFKCWIKNTGSRISKYYKLSALFFNLPKGISCNNQLADGKISSMNICEYCFKISSHNNEPIFSGELVEIGHYELHVPKHLTEDFNKVYH